MFTIIRLVFRTAGFVSLALAVVFAISDGSRAIAQSDIGFKPLGQIWFEFSPESLNLSQAVVQRHLHPVIWDPMLQNLLTWPAWAVFAPLGLILLWAGARRYRAKPQFA